MIVNFKKLNPNAFYLLQYMRDALLRFIFEYGGSSSAKSYSTAQAILIITLLDGENTLVMRKVGASISKTIYEDFKVAARGLGIYPIYKFTMNRIECKLNGARVDFSGLDDPEKIKGISNYKRVLLEELSEFEFADFKQLRKRLRGKKGQQIIATFNPISCEHWIKKEIIDKDKWHDVPMEVVIGGKMVPEELTKVKSLKMNEPKVMLNPRTNEIEKHESDAVLIQSTYLNNFWVVGSPDGTYGYYDEQCVADFEHDKSHDPDYYKIYALGEWGVIRTGSEYLASFTIGKNTGGHKYNPELPIHLSVDSNVLPYISTSWWQAEIEGDETNIYEVFELCAETPNNSVRKAAKLVADKLHNLDYADKLYLHGDASTRAANNIDDEKRSFLDLFILTLQEGGIDVVDCVGSSNPSVAMTGEFINQVFEGGIPGVAIGIDEGCKASIDDYQSVQKDVNGSILKVRIKNSVTKQSYEEHGHLTDTMRYVVYDLVREKYNTFASRRKRNKYAGNGMLNYYNPSAEYNYTDSMLYLMPNYNGYFIMLSASRLSDKWHIRDIIFRPSVSTTEIINAVKGGKANLCIVECNDSYFGMVKDMRQVLNADIRVMREFADVESRISATSDYVSSNILFLESEDADYSSFILNLLDYNKDNGRNEAGACLSGFAQYVMRI